MGKLTRVILREKVIESGLRKSGISLFITDAIIIITIMDIIHRPVFYDRIMTIKPIEIVFTCWARSGDIMCFL
jgi:hypothetical protein